MENVDKPEIILNKAVCESATEDLARLYKKITGKDADVRRLDGIRKDSCKTAGVSFEKSIYAQQMNAASELDKRASIETHDPAIDLDQSIEEENKAAMDYEQRAANAAYADDPKTGQLFLHIASEERKHAQEFTDRRNVVGGR